MRQLGGSKLSLQSKITHGGETRDCDATAPFILVIKVPTENDIVHLIHTSLLMITALMVTI